MARAPIGSVPFRSGFYNYPNERCQKNKTKKSSKCDTLPKRPFKKRPQWSKQAMLDAMKATSLHNRIKGRVIHGVKPGPKQYLSAEEETEIITY